ncbi:hypothetical protein Y1Q_0018239 [Alligator mississippiensis]|uniref:Uncharacterized protein n=1 Tax=Alligator mississippiensis TaxID=8496 RepID=A0A151MCS4_ALLMI|nr:hypothetical protein Y1Q_0018239 [Alligator mississippiensis]
MRLLSQLRSRADEWQQPQSESSRQVRGQRRACYPGEKGATASCRTCHRRRGGLAATWQSHGGLQGCQH